MDNLEIRIIELEKRLATDAKTNGSFVSRLLSPLRFLLGTLLVALTVGSLLYAVTIPNTFSDGTAIVAADVNANFTTLATGINTNETALVTNASNIGTNTTNITTNGTNYYGQYRGGKWDGGSLFERRKGVRYRRRYLHGGGMADTGPQYD